MVFSAYTLSCVKYAYPQYYLKIHIQKQMKPIVKLLTISSKPQLWCKQNAHNFKAHLFGLITVRNLLTLLFFPSTVYVRKSKKPAMVVFEIAFSHILRSSNHQHKILGWLVHCCNACIFRFDWTLLLICFV